jgi:hypothetical protein
MDDTRGKDGEVNWTRQPALDVVVEKHRALAQHRWGPRDP